MGTMMQSGKYEILESKAFFLDTPQSELVLHLVNDEIVVGDIKIRFLSRENESHSIEAKVQEGILMIDCVNFDNSLGTGTTMPMEIGRMDGKKLKLHLWSYMLGDGEVRKVEYSIYKEI